MQSETGDKRRREQAGTGQTEQEQASASKDMRRCNQRQVTNAGRNGQTEQASASKDTRRCNQRQAASAGKNKREEERAGAILCRAYNKEGRPNGQPP